MGNFLIKTEIVPVVAIVFDLSVTSEDATNDFDSQLAEISEEDTSDDAATFTLGMAGVGDLTGTDEATVTVTVGGSATGGTDYTPAVLAAIDTLAPPEDVTEDADDIGAALAQAAAEEQTGGDGKAGDDLGDMRITALREMARDHQRRDQRMGRQHGDREGND